MSDVSTFTPRFLSAPEHVLAFDEPDDGVAVLVRNRGGEQTIERNRTRRFVLPFAASQ